MRHAFIIGLGASLGDRAKTLQGALRWVAAQPGLALLKVSRLYWSAPVGPARRPFLNCAALVETSLSPLQMLARCKSAEGVFGRRPAVRWADRVLDVDILLWSGGRVNAPELQIPHPELEARPFALAPAAEVGPGWRLPGLGPSLAELAGPVDPQCRPVGVVPIGLGRGLAADRVERYTMAPVPTQQPRLSDGSPRSLRPPMKIFIDTANIDEIREAASWGIVDGVTTNPSLVAREGGDFVDMIHSICTLIEGPVSAETTSVDAEGMIREGRLLAQVSPHVVVKVPLTKDGLKATKALSDEGTRVNVTLCFHSVQALLAAKAGATYISPFLGRLDDICSDGVILIEQIRAIYDNFPALDTEILAASIRHPLHVNQVALAGADVATIPFGVLNKLLNHPLTDSGNARFLADWANVPDNDIAAQVTRWLAEQKA